MTEHRRTVIVNVLGKMSANYRSELIPALQAFAEAAGEIPEGQVWSVGWTTGQPRDAIGNSRESDGTVCGAPRLS
jgi:hypothetical protein